MAFYGVKSDKTIKKLLRGDLVAPIVEEDGKMYESRLTQQNEVVRVVDPEGLFVEDNDATKAEKIIEANNELYCYLVLCCKTGEAHDVIADHDEDEDGAKCFRALVAQYEPKSVSRKT